MHYKSRTTLQANDHGKKKVSCCQGELLGGSGWWLEWNGAVCGQRHSGVLDIPWAPARTQRQRASQRPAVLLVSPGLHRPDLNFRSPEKAKGLPHPRLLARPHLCGQRLTHDSVRPRDRRRLACRALGGQACSPFHNWVRTCWFCPPS